jgi:peptide deformylase
MGSTVENLTIVLYPDPRLRRQCAPVEAVDDHVRDICRRMLQLMHEAPGVGLAAPQVGLSSRLFVANATGDPADDMVFINPTLIEPSRRMEELEEGCLSLPEIRALIRRPIQITIEATDIDGSRFQATSDELPARIWQHEYDHLDGILITDRMAPIDRMANQKALREMEKDAARG